MRFVNFKLRLKSRATGGWPMDAESETEGEYLDGQLGLDLDAPELRVVDVWVAGGRNFGPVQAPAGVPADAMAWARSLGALLFDHLFTGANGVIGDIFRRTWEGAEANPNQGMRLRLHITAPELAALPWELLHARETWPRRGFLAASVKTVVVRYVDLPRPIRELRTRLPLRMLVALPTAPGLRLDVEKAAIERVLRDLVGLVDGPHYVEPPVTRERIAAHLAAGRHDIFHFAGHGGFDETSGTARLRLNDADGGEDWLDQDQFTRLFADHPSVKLVVLNACEGARVSSTRALLGMAPGLVQGGVPAVLAMQRPIDDAAAATFAPTFFDHLLRGPMRGHVEVAIAEARKTLADTRPDRPDFAIPVLYLRAAHGMLFDLVSGNVLRDTPIRKADFDRLRALELTYRENLRLLAGAAAGAAARAEARRQRRDLRRLRARMLAGRGLKLVATTVLPVLLALAILEAVGAFDRSDHRRSAAGAGAPGGPHQVTHGGEAPTSPPEPATPPAPSTDDGPVRTEPPTRRPRREAGPPDDARPPRGAAPRPGDAGPRPRPRDAGPRPRDAAPTRPSIDPGAPSPGGRSDR